MATWDSVETDFGDETRNFGPRQESGSALYEVNTIATIAQREPDVACRKPCLSAAVVGETAGVVANQHLSVFKSLQFVQTLQFDAVIDVIAWSPDEAFLVLGGCNGCLYVVEPNSLEVICNTAMLPPNQIAGRTFQKIAVRNASVQSYEILILSTSSQMFVIRGATTSVFMDDTKSFQEKLTIEMADTSKIHTKDTHDALFMNDNIVSLGSGDSIIGVWSLESGQMEVVSEGHSRLEGDVGILSGCVTTDNNRLMLLDEKNRLTEWDAYLLILLSVWDESEVQSFFLLETGGSHNKSLEGVKVVMMTSHGGKTSLQVKTLPGWEPAYTLKLFPTCLVDSLPSQESLYIVEWCAERTIDREEPHLRVRCLTEALPETRLIRLLNKNRFDDAMHFAKLFNLDKGLVYKAKCKYLLDQVSAWNVGKHDAKAVNEMICDLHECLSHVKDVMDIIVLFTYVALPTMSATHRILLYVKKLMMSFLQSEKTLTDSQRFKATLNLNKLMDVIHRLTTFKLVYGQTGYSAEKWERFMKCNLLEETIFYFKQGELGKSLAISSRHQHDWVTELDAESIKNLLNVIPCNIMANQLTAWITQDFLPFIVNNIPEAFAVLLQWVISKSLNMERSEKDKWPGNAIKFLRFVYRAGAQSTFINSSTPEETVKKTQVNTQEVLQSLQSQILKLQHLHDLQKKYKFHLSYSQFEQESTESVTFRMLDKVVAIELIAPALKQQIRPYVNEHGLKEDEIFSNYINDLLERMGRDISYHGEAPWEAKAVAVITYISSSELKCEAILEVMKYASIPWTEDIKNLVQSGLRLDHPKVKLLKDQCSATRIKEILLKYDLKNVKVEDLDESVTFRLIKFILSKDAPCSVEDVLVIIDLKRLPHSVLVDTYFFRLRFLVEKDRVSDALLLLQSLSGCLSHTCAKLMVTYAEVMMNEPIRWKPEFEIKRKIQFAAAGVKFCTYLIDNLKDHVEVEEYVVSRHELDSIQTLQKDFGEMVLLNKYRQPEEREALLKRYIQHIFSKTGTEMNALSYTKLFRLADVLQIGRARLLSQLVLHAAKCQQVEVAIELCSMLLECEPTPETGVVLYEVAKTLSMLQNQLATLENPPVDLLRKLPKILNDMASQAVIICPPDLGSKCLELCRATDLYRRVCGQCETKDYDMSEQIGDATCQDPYNVWNLDTVFREDALVLDSTLALPLASKLTHAHMQLVETSMVTNSEVKEADKVSTLMSDFSGANHQLTAYLHKNGHIGLSLEFLRQMMATSMRCLLQQLRDPQQQFFENDSSKCTDMTRSLLSKVLNQSRVDHRLALSHLSSLPKAQSMKVLKKGVATVGHNYKMSMSVAKVGIAVTKLYRDPASLLKFQELEKNATWGHRLSKLKINFRDAFMSASSEKVKLLPAMAQCEAVNITLIKDFCRSFQIDTDEGILTYLENLLLTPPPLATDLNKQQQQQAQLERARSALQEVTLRDHLVERLFSLLEQVNAYNYEVIQFILEEILALSPPSRNVPEQGLQLLRYLKVYRRYAPPTREEIRFSIVEEADELICEVDNLHPLSKDRLPYHPLMSSERFIVIKPELNYSTVMQWIPMANLLGVSSDKLFMAAITNTVQLYKENNTFRLTAGVDASAEKSHCNWELSEDGADLLRKLNEMFQKLSSCDIAVACCVSAVISALPIGIEKVMAIKQCKSFVETWYRASLEGSADRERALCACAKFSELYQRLSTERILYQANMAEPELLQLAINPKALIQKLYQHPSILQLDDEISGPRPDIHGVAQDVADVNNLQLDKMVNGMIVEWLPGDRETEDDTDATMTFSFSNADFAKEESVAEDEESSLRRVMYLLQSKTQELSCQFLFHYFKVSQSEGELPSNQFLVRTLRCLLQLADDKTIQRVCGEKASDTRQRLQVLMYLVELDNLNIQHTVDTFSQCNKEALVKAVWQKHSHKKIAVQLVCDICLDYKVYDVHLWSSILQKLQAFAVTQKLENTLVRVSAIKELWLTPSLPKMWQELLTSFLNKGLPPLPAEQIQECTHAINLLRKCPVVEELDLSALCQQCKRVEMFGCALGCVVFMMDYNQQIQHVKDVMSVGLTPVLKSMRLAEEHGLSADIISQVEKIVFLYVEMSKSYEAICKSSNLTSFVSYLIQEDDVSGLLEYLFDNNRLKQAGHVVDTYLEKGPNVPAHLIAACQGKPDQLKVQIFLQAM